MLIKQFAPPLSKQDAFMDAIELPDQLLSAGDIGTSSYISLVTSSAECTRVPTGQERMAA